MFEGVAVVNDSDARRAVLQRAPAELAHDGSDAVMFRRGVHCGCDGTRHVQVLDDGCWVIIWAIHIAEQTRGYASEGVVKRDGVAVTVEVAGEVIFARHDGVCGEAAHQLDVLAPVIHEEGVSAELFPVLFAPDEVRVIARTAAFEVVVAIHGPSLFRSAEDEREEQEPLGGPAALLLENGVFFFHFLLFELIRFFDLLTHK